MANNLNLSIRDKSTIYSAITVNSSFLTNYRSIMDNNIYKKPNTRVHGMSSRQQVLFLLQKTQKEANWDMENDSDF